MRIWQSLTTILLEEVTKFILAKIKKEDAKVDSIGKKHKALRSTTPTILSVVGLSMTVKLRVRGTDKTEKIDNQMTTNEKVAVNTKSSHHDSVAHWIYVYRRHRVR